MNLITGLNGVGKTSILEAIHLSVYGKSYFTSNDKNNIQYQKEFMRSECLLKDSDENSHEVVVKLQPAKSKILELNGKKIGRLSNYIGRFLTVCISPEDIKLVKGQSSDRRTFLDQCISQYNKQYTAAISKYSKTIVQRNALLKRFLKFNSFDKNLLDAIDKILIETAPIIHKCRSEFIESFNVNFQKAYAEIAPNAEHVIIGYESKLSDVEMEELLETSLQKDRITARTNVGIHKDDLSLSLMGSNIRQFGSQGQVKSFVVAMKLAQFQYLIDRTEKIPIFIMDDMFDKLDKVRVEKILFYIHNTWNAQTFISDTDKDRISIFFEQRDAIFRHIHISENQKVESIHV